MRLIDQHALRKALEDNICEDCDKDPNCLRCGSCLMDVAIEYIIAAPTIDAVEVVRCNQCRHYQGNHKVPGCAPCKFWGIGAVMWDDYCKRGERWDDD